MRDPVAGQTSLVIVGASGMVGGHALRYALDNPAVGVVIVIGRKQLGLTHPKIKEVLHQDFTDCAATDGAACRHLLPRRVRAPCPTRSSAR